jgi:hypothetical protein
MMRQLFNTVLRMLPSKLKYFLGLYSIDSQTKAFIDHNIKTWGSWRVTDPTSVILVDLFRPSVGPVAYSYFLNVLAVKKCASIKVFSSVNPYTQPELYRVYKSFNTKDFVSRRLSREQEKRKDRLSLEVKGRIVTKRDLFDLKVADVWIGIDIYESYLRKFSQPTVDLADQRLYDLIDDSIATLIFWSDFFEDENISAVVVSHDSYVIPDVLCKIAYHRKIPVYLPNVRGMSYADRPFSIYMPLFKEYRKMFNALPKSIQEEGLKLAKFQLEQRLSGDVGVDMPYATKSAFGSVSGRETVLQKSDKTKVLICSHCFYDNPHGYGGMLFLDFYEWLCFVGEITKKTDYDWYLKMHPDPLPGTEDVIKGIITKYPKIIFLPPETSFHQLVNEGLNFVLTVYGSVGHELPALGVQVVNAGYNPHIAYDFNWHAKTLAEYQRYLTNLDTLNKEIKHEELLEFYYMHYYYTRADDLFFPSYRKFLDDLTPEQQIGPEAYAYFLNNLTKERHEVIMENMRQFIDSGKTHYFSSGPE